MRSFLPASLSAHRAITLMAALQAVGLVPEGRGSPSLYDEAAFYAQTCGAIANVADGAGGRVIEITNRQKP